MTWQPNNPLGLEPFDDDEPWIVWSEPASGPPSGVGWFSPQACGCTCEGEACCPGTQTCLEIDLTIGTTDCCDIGDAIITLDALSDSVDDEYCVWDIATDEYPPSYLGGGYYWLTGLTIDDIGASNQIDCALMASLPSCYSETDGGITFHWMPWYLYVRIETSKTTGHIRITVGIGYLVYWENPFNSLCFTAGGGGSAYTIESNDCLAGPFTVTNVTKTIGARSWVPPTCDVIINSVYECV